jgi:hypothetical protein
MNKETKLSFTWIKEFEVHIKLELECTIALNVGDAMIYKYDNINYHLIVDNRVYVPEVNVLTIVFKEFKL